MEMGDLERFKARAMEIVRNSKDPASCLRLMRIKAVSILGAGDLDRGQLAKAEISNSGSCAGGRACSSLELSLLPEGIAAKSEGTQSEKRKLTAGTVESASTAIVPAEAQPVGTDFVTLKSCQGKDHYSADGAFVEEDSRETDEALGSPSDVQGTVQSHAPAVLGIQSIKMVSFSDLMNGISQNLELFNGMVYVQATTNYSFVRPFHKNYENSRKESDGTYAGVLRNTVISRICYGHGVLVEEEPDPGGLLFSMFKPSEKTG